MLWGRGELNTVVGLQSRCLDLLTQSAAYRRLSDSDSYERSAGRWFLDHSHPMPARVAADAVRGGVSGDDS